MFKKSRAQPPEDTRRKPVLGKLGTLFTAGRRRNTRNGLESPTNANSKSASAKLPEIESEKSKVQDSQPKPTDASEAGSRQEAEDQPEDSCIQATPCDDAKLSPCSSSSLEVVQQCHDSDSAQLEPLQAEGETFPNATTAAKEPHSSPGNCSGQESSETPARCPGEDALPGAGLQPETARGVSGSPPEERLVGGVGEAPDGAPGVGADQGSLGAPGDAVLAGEPPAQGVETICTTPQADRAHPSKVLTLDIYLSKTEVAQVDEPVSIAPGTDDCDDSDDMEKRSNGRRSGRRRKSQKSTDSPGADAVAPESPAKDDSVFDVQVAPDAAPENGTAERKVKSVHAVPDGPEPKATPSPRGQLRGDPDRGKQQPPTSSPTKRKGRSRVPEAVPSAPSGGSRAPAKESPPKKAPAAADGGEEAGRVVPRELTVKSSSLLPEIKPEHKRGPLSHHFDGRGEGGRSRESGRGAGASDADSLKPRNHFGAGRSTVTTKVTLPARPKHVELNLKTPKNPDSVGNESSSFSQPVNKGNTANKISLFENKRVNSSPRHAEVRSTRNNPPSNKTFVGRAKLNLAKKAKEMEQTEKKAVPAGHQNGLLVKEPSASEAKGMEVSIPREVGEQPAKDQVLCPEPDQTDKADVQPDAACPSQPAPAALAPVKDPTLSGEDRSEAADSKNLILNNMSDTTRDVPAIPNAGESPPKPQGAFSDSLPASESCREPSASVTVDTLRDGCAQVPICSVPRAGLEVPESQDGCVLPVSPPAEKMPVSKSEAGKASPPSSPEHSQETVGNGCPSKVLVQVRSFVLPVESPREVSSQVLSESSEVREGQLPSCHHNELEVVSVATCAPQQGDIPSPAPESTHGREESVAQSRPHTIQPGPERALPAEADRQSSGTTLTAEFSPVFSPSSRSHSESPQRAGQNVTSPNTPASLLNLSANSDESVFDSSSDMEKFTEIIKKMDSAVCVPQKKKKARVPNSPAPHFAMPPIHEDSLEKVFDPNVFTIGLGKKKENQAEMSPALHLLQNHDPISKLRAKRASTEQSVVFRSLHASAHGKSEAQAPSEVNDKESRDITNGGVKRSRLENSTLFSSMLSSLPHDKIFSPSVTSVSTMKTSFSSSQTGSVSQPSVAQPRKEGDPPCGSDKEQPPPAPHNSLKVFNFDSANTSHPALNSPKHMEKYLQKEESMGDLKPRSNLHLPENKLSDLSKLKSSNDVEKPNLIGSVPKSNLPNSGSTDTDFLGLFKASRYDPSLSFSGMSLSDSTTLRGSVHNKLNPRPGKVVIFSEPDVSEECIEVFGDIQDCSSWRLSPVVLVKVVRGCWILYEKANFEGHSLALEEGELELSGLWGTEEEILDEEAESDKSVVIGSIRHVVQDYRISQIDLFTEPEGLGLLNSYFDDTEEMQGFGVMQKTCSIKVHWGTWLIYEEPGFQGVPFILEPGEYPDLSFWDTEEAYIGSMRPLKMGGRKVEFPTDPKVVIYEKPSFEGRCMELEAEMCSFITEGGETEEATGGDCLPFTSVGSMKVLRGVWVAYEKCGFTGHQYLLEEGEYRDWKDWGGYSEDLQSLRPILSDFSNAHMIMYSEKNFGSKGSSIDVLGIVANLKETGYGVKTQSINVLSGVWVAYENPDFTGEQYVLDKGFYTSFEDWGGKNCKISSVQPISLDSLTGPRRRNQIHLFSEPQFRGQSQSFEETISQIDDSFLTKSCRVLGGSWVAYDGENFSGNQYVLEEGHYPCLSAMGCLPGATLKSLRFIDVEFSEPTIILFERENFKGKKIELSAETVNLRCMGFNTQIRSVQVVGGIWVTYEYGNYRGRQFLLSPAEVPNWYEFSGCRQIGSLRPFVQKRIYFRLRNKATGLFMSTNGNLEDLKLLRIQVMEDVGADDQIWVYQEGCIKCRIAEDCCLTIVGSLVTSGSKLGLALDQNADSQFWCMKSDGRIYSKLKPNLVLDVKGGAQYDQNHIILNTANTEKLTQVWEAMVL
ncbi:beta/gamma crystallin domain-containing protein 1 isoform X2 [Acomys russatus]|uniref:beta/gamma crystallin domain-containing protein 1 isoform X2 n=1 Tax=Acomys russatus TaxID=60746 RepID=UPI0021E2C03A|nr:beta/gamma crystallin domain-containing protein 1 isoform X2 [Acomys russatus]